ncbi:2',3'-cyclic-nucleotide 3'-phosphodiesterase [Anarhichas minor]|uniref:2',3'-cyclic-nucleotide 3'-phosphodiesterase n=1 Tax=Anarhichas minor TaxID=65739 RepID=UPI003F73CB69
MDLEKSAEVLDLPGTEVEKAVVSKVEMPEECPEPEKPPAADEAAEQLAVTGHDAEVPNLKETQELIVTQSEGTNKMEIEKSDMVPVAVTPPDLDESSEKTSGPVAALDTEPENKKPVPENDPEPSSVQTPLAESAPEPEPEKLAESVPQADLQGQTLPESTALQLPVDAQPASQQENGSVQVGTVTELQTAMDTVAEEVSKEVVGKDVAAEPTMEVKEEKAAEVSSVKPTEAVTLKEEASAESMEPAKGEKETSDTLKEAAAEGVKSEKIGAEVQKEEDTAPASGSLSFALLDREQTKDALRASRTLVVLRGLPGSGKSFLARAIAEAYDGHCSVFCADDHGVKPENPESSAEGYRALDEAVVAFCSAGTASSVLVVVVDDTNHTQDRLARLGDIAAQQRLVAVFLEPRTEWSRDPAQLTKKTGRGLEVAQLEAMRGSLEEMSLPLYFGWFLLSSIQDKVRCTSMDFLKTLDTLEAFKKHLIDFTGKAEKEVDLEQYFQAKGTLHCTAKFCDYGKAEGAKEYAQNPAVKDLYGAVFELSLSALFVTPRTVGARVSLSEEQLLLWPADAEKAAGSAPLPLGSRAHITLGCAEGVEPLQTGLDLLEILALPNGELIEEMELGSLTYYGEGRWLLALREPICTPACFSSFYDHKEVELTKKEPEKKKKNKCTIL